MKTSSKLYFVFTFNIMKSGLVQVRSRKKTLSVPLLSRYSFFTSYTPTKSFVSPSRRFYRKSYCFHYNDWKVNKGVMQFLYAGLRELHVWFVADTVANFFTAIRAATLNGSVKWWWFIKKTFYEVLFTCEF